MQTTHNKLSRVALKVHLQLLLNDEHFRDQAEGDFVFCLNFVKFDSDFTPYMSCLKM